MVVVAISVLASDQSIRVKAQQSIDVRVEFDYLRQGTAGVITLTGPNLAGAIMVALGRTYRFFPTSLGYAALLSVPMDQKIKEYPMMLTAYRSDNSTTTWEGTLKVESGEFIAEPQFTMPSNKAFLLRQEIEQSEEAKLLAIFSFITSEHFWDGPFKLPVDGKLGSPFGSVRTYTNDGKVRRHTGDDLRAPARTPVLASANGRVVFARSLDIHGNTVIIDHGWGVFSEYAHLSEIYVVPGQFVLQGEVIGLSGDTGRSAGPHLHWEIAVNDIRVNPAAFVQLKLPN